MRILVTGGHGLLGRALAAQFAHEEISAPGHEELDVTDPCAVAKAFAKLRPQVVLHCAALTGVERCERDPSAAAEVNIRGAALVANTCREEGARLVAFSSADVFDGRPGRPFSEFDTVTGSPTACGRSRWAGERTIRLSCPDHVIVRTSWLYGAQRPGIVRTLLDLADGAHEEIPVASDRVGNPTSARAVAKAVAALLERPQLRGTFHLASEGCASWFDFARALFELCGIDRKVVPCTGADLPGTPILPANACLECRMAGLRGLPPMPRWRDDLAAFLAAEQLF